MGQLSSNEVWELGRRCTITVEARTPRVEFADGTCVGYMTFRTFCTDVSDDEGNRIGEIGGGAGSVVVVVDGETWHIKHDDLWYAFQEALKNATPKVIYDRADYE